MFKKLIFFILLTVSLTSNAQPGPEYRYKREMGLLEKEVLKYPDSLALHHRLFYLYTHVATKQQAIEKIDFLLSKKPNSIEYLTSKFWFLLDSYPYITESKIKKGYQFYLKNLEPKVDNCTKKKHLITIARHYESAKIYKNAFFFYDKALKISNCDKENAYISERKEELYHQLKDYKNSYKISRKRGLYLSNIKYSTIYLKDYKKSIKELYTLIEGQEGAIKKGNKYYMPKVKKRILQELAYNYYKLGDLDKALTILHLVTQVNFGFDLFDSYQYWCMYLDLYEQYKNTDYRVHLLFAHRYIAETSDLRTSAYFTGEVPQPRCDPHDGLKIPKNISNENKEKFIINLGIKEIVLAEKLAHKKFDLYRAEALMEMKEMDQAKKILDMMIKKNPNDLETLSSIRTYYFLKELHLSIFDKSKKNLDKKEKYDRLRTETLDKYEKLSKQSKKEPIVIEGY